MEILSAQVSSDLVIYTVWVLTHCSKINTEQQKGKSDGFFYIAPFLCTYSSLWNVLPLVRTGLESPCYMTYISLVKSTGKIPGHFKTPTSGSCVTMSSLGLFVCDTCDQMCSELPEEAFILSFWQGGRQPSTLHTFLVQELQPPEGAFAATMHISFAAGPTFPQEQLWHTWESQEKDLCGSSSKTRHQNPC